MIAPTWAHVKRFCRFEDPINLIFRWATLQEVLDELDSDQWTVPKIWFVATGGDLFLRHNTSYDHTQDAQRIRGGKLVRRYHVRLWEWEGLIVGGAHYEELSGIRHRVYSFDDGKRQVERSFLGKPSWTISPDSDDLRNSTDYPPHNGYASVIRRP